MSVNRLMKGFHPEIGIYWNKALKEAETTYFEYLKDVSSTRVSLQPKPDMDLLTDIEARIEAKMKPLLMNAVPQVVSQQCMFLEDLNCTQVLYRTMVMAGPASKEDRKYMHELLTQPREVEATKLYDQLIMWQFARNRLKKYGFNEPEPSQLYDTLKMMCLKLTEKNPEFNFTMQTFTYNHSSVNGLVNKETVDKMYDLILDHARAWMIQPQSKDPKVAKINNFSKVKNYLRNKLKSREEKANEATNMDSQSASSSRPETKRWENSPTDKGSQKGKSKGKGKKTTKIRYTYAFIKGKRMRQKFNPQAKELQDWETDPDPDEEDDDYDQEDGDHELPDSKEDHDNEEPLANQSVLIPIDTEKLAMSRYYHTWKEVVKSEKIAIILV